MLIPAHAKLLMIGDSITDAERARPIGEGLFDAGGNGYVSLVRGWLETVYPDRCIRVVNMGQGGDTVRALKARWQRDVLDLKPTWLSVMIGINDVWRQFDLPLQTEEHVLPDEYAQTLDEIIVTLRPTLDGLILLTPFHIEANPQDPMRAMMDRYGQMVREAAAKHCAILVDTQAAFDRVLAHRHSNAIAWDRIHPNIIGTTILARAFLQAIEFEF
jgi:lysophospholipase L1-like esterase